MLKADQYEVKEGYLTFSPKKDSDYIDLAALIENGDIKKFEKLLVNAPNLAGMEILSDAIIKYNPQLETLSFSTENLPADERGNLKAGTVSRIIKPLLPTTALHKLEIWSDVRSGRPLNLDMTPTEKDMLRGKEEIARTVTGYYTNIRNDARFIKTLTTLVGVASPEEREWLTLMSPAICKSLEGHACSQETLQAFKKLVNAQQPEGVDVTPTRSGLLALADRLKDLPNTPLTAEQLETGRPATLIGAAVPDLTNAWRVKPTFPENGKS